MSNGQTEVSIVGATLAVMGAAVAWFVVRGCVTLVRAHVRRWRGQCEQCGYDLTGIDSGRCPECGSKAARI